MNASGLVILAQSLPVVGLDPSALERSPYEVIAGENTTASYATYGDVIFHLTDRVNLTAGLRYSYDDKEFEQYDSDNNTLNASGVLFPTLAQLENPADVVTQDTWSNLSGRVELDYLLGEEALVYASIAQGYKSGGFNTTRTVGVVDGEYIAPSDASEPFDEETNINIEIGLKSTMMDGRLRLNSSLYAYEYKDLQFLLGDQNSSVARTINAPAVEVHGADLEVQFAASSKLSLFANMAYLNAEYSEDIVDVAGVTRFEKGQETIFAPELSGAIGLDYVTSLDGMGDLRFNTSYSYTGEHQQRGIDAISEFDPSVSVSDSYSVLNARVSWLSKDEH